MTIAQQSLAVAGGLTRSKTGAPLLTTPRSGFGGRGYKIPGRPKVYPGVTTVLKQVNKPGLYQWIADMTAARAVMNLNTLMMRSEDVGWGMLRFFWSHDNDVDDDSNFDPELRTFYQTVKDDRAELGSNIHAHVEADLGQGVYPPVLSHETEQMIDVWEEFLDQHLIVSHRSEFTVVDDIHGVAGTADADWSIGCEHDGPPCLRDSDVQLIRTLVDVKTSRHTWREHGHQLGGLSMCQKRMIQVPAGTEGCVKAEKTEKGEKVVSFWIEEDLPSFDAYALLHIRPDDLDNEGGAKPRFAQLKEVRNIEPHRKGFLGAVALMEAEYELKQAAKLGGWEWEGI